MTMRSAAWPLALLLLSLTGCGGGDPPTTTVTVNANTSGGEIDPWAGRGTFDGWAGGPRDASTVGVGCVGFIPVAPQYQFHLSAPTEVSIHATSAVDATLVVVRPDGSTLCNDDSDGLNPRVTASLGPGDYLVFVGTYDAGPPASFHLELGPPPVAPIDLVAANPTIPGAPLHCGMTVPNYGSITLGMPVVLGAHTGWSGPDGHGGYVTEDTWWNDAMWSYVGMTGLVTEFGLDPIGCPFVRVDVDGGSWGWRIRNLSVGSVANYSGVPTGGLGMSGGFGGAPSTTTPLPGFTGVAIAGVPGHCGMSIPDYGPIYVGMSVSLGPHSPWSGPDGRGGYATDDTWWNDAMWPFVGMRATVTELSGLDPVGCPYVHVEVDGGTWGWRIRDLRP